jgi:D-beta-D-heptose 7-phosphate kinase/D-beta-D-heptose 1-phosphate adenosyltransferase
MVLNWEEAPRQALPTLPAAVLLTDYGRGAVTPESVTAWAAWCRARAVPLLGDPKLGRGHVWHVALDTMVLNWEEACENRAGYVPDPNCDHQTALGVAHGLLAGWGDFAAVVVKRGYHGSLWATKAGDVGHVPAVHPVLVRDVQGAGDTYLAALAVGRARGLSLADACLYASAAAGVAVGKPGTAVVSAREAAEALSPLVTPPLGVVPLAAAAALVARLQAFGLTVAYCPGCYDLLGPQHRATVAHAATLADVVVAGVDSDARVRRLKGPTRPVNPEGERAAALAALKGVVAAFVFDEPAEAAADKIRPDVLVRGGDYAPVGVVEREAVERHGGRLVIAPKVAGESTTLRLERIRACPSAAPGSTVSATTPCASSR